MEYRKYGNILCKQYHLYSRFHAADCDHGSAVILCFGKNEMETQIKHQWLHPYWNDGSDTGSADPFIYDL